MSYKINQWLVWTVLAGLVYFSFAYLSNIILYIVLAIILAFIGRPLVYLLSEKGLFGIKLPRPVSAILSLSALGGIFLLFGLLLMPLLSKQVLFLQSINYHEVVADVEVKLRDLTDRLEDMKLWPTKEEWDKIINNAMNLVSAQQIGNYFGSAINFSVNVLITLFSVFFIAFFLLKDANLLNQIILSATPDKQLGKMTNALTNIKELLSRYFLGVLIQVFIVSMLVYAGLAIVGVQNALILGIIAGLLNLIPYVGPYIGGAFGIVLGITSELAIDSSVHLGYFSLKILAVYIIAQVIDNVVLQPLIFSKSVKAHPLEIFLVVLIAGTLFGIIGMLAAIPVYTILRVVAREFFPELKFVQKLTDKIEKE